jgi:hypothetical protein
VPRTLLLGHIIRLPFILFAQVCEASLCRNESELWVPMFAWDWSAFGFGCWRRSNDGVCNRDNPGLVIPRVSGVEKKNGASNSRTLTTPDSSRRPSSTNSVRIPSTARSPHPMARLEKSSAFGSDLIFLESHERMDCHHVPFHSHHDDPR